MDFEFYHYLVGAKLIDVPEEGLTKAQIPIIYGGIFSCYGGAVKMDCMIDSGAGNLQALLFYSGTVTPANLQAFGKISIIKDTPK